MDDDNNNRCMFVSIYMLEKCGKCNIKNQSITTYTRIVTVVVMALVFVVVVLLFSLLSLLVHVATTISCDCKRPMSKMSPSLL